MVFIHSSNKALLIHSKRRMGNVIKAMLLGNTGFIAGEYNQEIKGETNVEIIPVIA